MQHTPISYTTTHYKKNENNKFHHVSSNNLYFANKTGAGNEIRTRDLNLGKVALYQLSYSRFQIDAIITSF